MSVRIERDYEVDPETGCWVWQRGRASNGYGSVYAGRNAKGHPICLGAHRVYYERFHGTIPPGSHVHHVCGNRPCVNPDHLQAMTKQEHASLESRKLTVEDVREIRFLFEDCGLTRRTLAKLFDVSYTAIQDILSGRNWAHV